MGWLFLVLCLPEVSVACWGWRSRIESCRAASRLAHKSSLSIHCLSSISFVWILGTRVIRFKVNTRQSDHKKKKKSSSFPQIFFPNLPWNPQPPPGRPETPCWPAHTGEGTWADWVLQEGGLFKAPPPCQFMSRVTILFMVGPLSDS